MSVATNAKQTPVERRGIKVGSAVHRTGIQVGRLAVNDWKINHTHLEG